MNERSRALDRQLFGGIAWFRGAAWVWVVIVALISTSKMTHPVLGWFVIGCAGVVTGGLVRDVSTRTSWPLTAVPLLLDLAMGAALLIADGWVYQNGRPQSLATAWPVAGLLAVGVARGAVPSVIAACGLGCARAIGLIGMSGAPSSWHGGEVLSVVSTVVLYALAGVAAATVTQRIRFAEDRAARAAAREEISRDLHDGMLQTLAAIQRRSTDTSLVQLARTQEADLRSYLFASPEDSVTERGRTSRADEGDIEACLRVATTNVTRTWGLEVRSAFVSPLPALPLNVLDALSGAVGECLTNAAKHATVDVVHLLVDVDDGLVRVVIRDRGVGFDAANVGLRGFEKSVRARLREHDGNVQLESAPGVGTQVTLTVAVGTIPNEMSPRLNT